MLAFLLVDTLQEGLELAGEAAIAFQGQALVWFAAAIALLNAHRGGPTTG